MKSEFNFDEKIMCPGDHTATKERIEQYKEYYKIKYKLCKDQNPKVIAEIGVRAGYSAWTFLQACPEAKYVGFDANTGTHGGKGGEDGKFARWSAEILKDYDAELIELDTQKVNDLKINDVDFFHVDGDHTTKGVQHDLDLAFKAISDTGLIVVDDITYLPEVSDGVFIWVDKMKNEITSEFVESLRGEMLIRKRI
jgi:predicted O-methyltransferase YrrM